MSLISEFYFPRSDSTALFPFPLLSSLAIAQLSVIQFILKDKKNSFNKLFLCVVFYKQSKKCNKLFTYFLLDIDECLDGQAECDSAAICKNTIGGYTCKCKEGYKETEDGKCEGI